MSAGDQQRRGDAFGLPSGEWVRVSGRLATARRLTAGAIGAVGLGLAGALAAVERTAVVGRVAVAVVVVATLWSWWIIGRRVRAIGWAERADDLVVVSGVMFRRLVVVPYGRMQLVDVTAGPLDRALGITAVQLHTAAATTDAVIPGLVPDDAARLRDRLAERGEQRSAGL